MIIFTYFNELTPNNFRLADFHVFPAAFYEEKNFWEELGLNY